MTNQRGFTLVELITALVLFGIVGGTLYQLLIRNQQYYREQTERVEVNEQARTVTAVLPGEIRELNAGDPAGSDIIAMATDQLTYKTMRNLYVLCQAPNVAGLQVTVSQASYYGLRPITAARDSVLIFAEGDPSTRNDDGWLHANVSFVNTGTACPGSRPSVTLTLTGVVGAQLSRVQDGAPVRGFEVARVQLYQNAGAWWLGGQVWEKAAGQWGTLFRLAGPLANAGLSFTYLDANGVVTAVPAQVARVGITVQSRSELLATGLRPIQQDLVTSVALRNNPIY